jgi:hypothetical protein
MLGASFVTARVSVCAFFFAASIASLLAQRTDCSFVPNMLADDGEPQ